MGSDDGRKHKVVAVARAWMAQRRRSLVIILGGTTFLILIFRIVVPSPEVLQTSTFSASVAHIPKQCQETVQTFYECQQSENTLVLACHRKWCNSFGHCEPCAGIGDRTRCLLHQVGQAAKECRRVQLDYPLEDVSLLDSALYKDPSGWLGEVFRYRTYDFSVKRQSPIVNGVQYSHFFEVGGQQMPHWDPCYFHALFQPSPKMQNELSRHRQALGGRSIGIHFRTGDAAAFGIGNNDTRVASLQEGWNQMQECANRLAEQLFGSLHGVTFFLATDNAELKSMVKGQVYTTDPLPASYLTGVSGDRDAWVELFLLSSLSGLVMNAISSPNYKGPAFRTSLFAQLASRIGFMNKTNTLECHVG